jgi:hypothetical protein
VVACVAAASMWFYVNRILIAYQTKDAAAHERPRGNLSDLYPRWLGARELLLHQRNPYSDEITIEIQKGYYGRALDPARPDDPKDRQGFAYPVYVVFLLAPLIELPFVWVQAIFYWLLACSILVSVVLWLRVAGWKLPMQDVVACLVLTIGSFPALQGVKLQQLSLLVAVLIAGAAACTVRGNLFLAGELLALATIKPQLAWILAGWFLLWATGDWRARRRLWFGFWLTMLTLLVGSEVVLPGWVQMFAEAVAKYHRYTENQSVLEVMFSQVIEPRASRMGGEILALAAIFLSAPVLWKMKRQMADSQEFSYAVALAAALTVLVVPMYAPYNQVLLLPAIFLLSRERNRFAPLGSRLALMVGGVTLAWQWVASLFLAVLYLAVSRDRAIALWAAPLFSTFALPIWTFASILFLPRADGMQAQEGRL